MVQSVGPQRFRVVPGPALVPRHGGQTQEGSKANRDDPDGARTPPRRYAPELPKKGGSYHDRAQHGHVTIAIRGHHVAEPNEAQVGRQDHQVTEPCRQ